MAREIIQMYDKYHSTKKVYPKVVEECLPEDYQGLPEEVEEKSTVVANPELAGTEDSLEGIEIDGTKYKAGGGKTLYQHNIKINLSSFKGTMTIISQSNEEINTGLKLFNFLKRTSFSTAYMFSGYHYNSASDIRNAYSISAENDNHIWWLTSKGTYDIAYTSIDGNITDIVEEL